VMMNAFRLKLNAQTDNLKSAAALEHQNNIRKKYADIDIIINHPICCGYLLNFCNIQFCAENLNFVCEVHRFQDLFAVDTNIWTKNWKVMTGFTLFLRQHSHFNVIIFNFPIYFERYHYVSLIFCRTNILLFYYHCLYFHHYHNRTLTS
jgi:hypothetical protein